MKAVLFDLDGTVLDTLEDLKNAVNHGLISFGFPPRSKEYVRLAIGNGTTKLMERCCPEGTPKEIVEDALAEFKKYYSEHYLENTVPYDGIKELLLELSKTYYIGIVSNKDDIFAKKLIDLLLPDIFNFVQGSYVDKPRKPYPYLVEKVLTENNLKREDCIYVGDTDIDAKTAQNSNISCLLVHYGYRKKEELLVQCPNETYVDSYQELIDKIKQVLR